MFETVTSVLQKTSSEWPSNSSTNTIVSSCLCKFIPFLNKKYRLIYNSFNYLHTFLKLLALKRINGVDELRTNSGAVELGVMG